MLQRTRALGGLVIINTLLALLIASRFYLQMPHLPEAELEWGFLLLGTFSHIALLVLLVATVSLPLVIFPKKLWVLLISGTAAFLQIFLYIDTIVFAQYKFHINGAVLELILEGQIVDFPLTTWLIVIGVVLAAWLAQGFLLAWLVRKAKNSSRWFPKFVGLTVISFIAASFIHIWAAAHAYQPVTSLKRYLPVYYPVSANSFMKKRGWINEEEVARQKALSQKRTGVVQYPLAPLTTKEVRNPVNIVLVVIDSWRYDTMNADNTPNIWQLAKQGVKFDNHQSAGNSTRTGIFGLFYGLPGTYWEGILSSQTEPVLMARMQELGYQIGVFASAQLRKPEFNRTVFAHVENLREESNGNSPSERDLDLLQDWQQWQLAKNSAEPSFSFLFFDAPHGYDYPKDFEPKFLPQVEEIDYLNLNNKTDPEPMFNRYKNSVLFTDGLVGQVIETLKKSGEYENTLIIVTGDHGQEMNDTRLNYWGHNSNFTRYQVQVPLVMAGPRVTKLKPNNAMTSHVDLAPTLLTEYLGVTNPVEDYSTGENLFKPRKTRPWVLASSYSMFAILTGDYIFEVDPTGQSELLDKENKHLKNEKLDAHYLQEAILQMSRFNR